MRLMSDTRNFGSLLEDIDKDELGTYVKNMKEMESKNDYGLFRRISIDIDELTKDCVFFYLFDMLSGRNRVSYVRDILCKSGVKLGELKQKVLNINHKEKGSYFKNFYIQAEDMFYEDVASSVSELVKCNEYIVKTILGMGEDDNKEAIRLGKRYVDFYNLNKIFIKKTYENFCNDNDEVSEEDISKLKELYTILHDIQSFIIKHTENFINESNTRGSLERVSYLILMLLTNADAYENKKSPLVSFIDSIVDNIKKVNATGVFKGISNAIDKKTPWYDGEIFDSIYTKRCIDRWTDSMVEYINEMPNREDVSSSIVVSNNALVTELSGIYLPINDSKVTVLRDFVYSFYVKEYYRYWVLEVNNRESISKLDLNKYMPERNLEDDFHSLLASYSALNIADWSKELYKAFVENSEIFKEVSTFEYSDEVKAWDEVTSLREELSRVRRELEGSNERYLKLLTDVSNKKGSRDSIQVINECKKELSIKDDEIKRLQGIIDSQQEFLDLMEMEENEEVEKVEEDENDLSILQSKSFVFVSRNNAINDAIKRLLPNSKFADSFTHKSSQTNYDGVVLIIGSISHPLYHRWVNYFKGTSTPVYAYIGGNAGKLLNYLKADMMGKRDCFEVGSSCKRIN